MIYWVDGSSAAEAETTARQQAGARITDDARAVVAHIDHLDAADDGWPSPQRWVRSRIVDPDRSQQPVVYTATRGTESYEKM